MKSSFYSEFKDRTLTIPTIQRDYIQPLDKKIIVPFVERIAEALSSQDDYLDLNYIYGIKSSDGTNFEPIDGQQRITTIWLVYLFLEANCSSEEVLPAITLCYKTREYAQDFTSSLIKNFSSPERGSEKWSVRNILMDKPLPSTLIQDAPWFRDSWSKDISVSSILSALDVIHEILYNRSDLTVLYTTFRNSHSISFAFKETDDLGDDIYVKMNARGKALSSFENLKAWLNENLKAKLGIDDSRFSTRRCKFYQNWCQSLDNEWLDLFWTNRNQNNYYPEEIDDSILRCIYTLLWCYWITVPEQKRTLLLGNLGKASNNELLRIGGIIGLKDLKEEVTPEIFMQRLLAKFLESKDYDMPLFILDKLNLFPVKIYIWLNNVLNGMCMNASELNTLNSPENPQRVWFWKEPEESFPIPLFTQLMLEENGAQINLEKALLCLSYASYSAYKDPSTTLERWMYHCRNLIYNYRNKKNQSRLYDFINSIAQSIKSTAKISKTKNIDEALRGNDTQLFRGFGKPIDGLIEEERVKAEIWLTREEWVPFMHELEDNDFFRGHISFIFQFLGKDIDKIKTSDFISYCILAKALFDEATFMHRDNPDRLLHRALLAQGSHYGIGFYNDSGAWTFMKYPAEWQRFFRDNDDNHNEAIGNLLRTMTDSMSDDKSINSIEATLNEIIKSSDVTDWRRWFIKDKCVWKAMGELACRWYSDFNIKLIPRYKLGKYRCDVRSYYFYRQFRFKYADRHADTKEYIKTEKGNYSYLNWDLAYYNEGDYPCLFVERSYQSVIIAIDVLFNHKSDNDDSFIFQLFVRDKDNQTAKEYVERNAIIPQNVLDKYHLAFNGQRNELKKLSVISVKALLIHIVNDLNKSIWKE